MRVRTFYMVLLLIVVSIFFVNAFFQKKIEVHQFNAEDLLVARNMDRMKTPVVNEEKVTEEKTPELVEPKSEPDYFATVIDRSIEHLENGKYDLARKALREAEKLQPGSSAVLAVRCRIDMDENKLDSAMVSVNKALKVNPRSVRNWINRGDINYRMKRYKKAEADYKAALKLEPRNPIALMGMAQALGAMNRSREALKFVEKTTKSEDSCRIRGRIYSKMRDNKKMLESFKAGLEKDPKDPVAAMGVAESLHIMNRPEEALEYIELSEKLLKECPDKKLRKGRNNRKHLASEILMLRCDVAYLKGDFKNTVRYSEKSLALKYTGDPVVYFNRGVSNYFLGRNNLARKDVEKFLNAKPDRVGADDFGDLGWGYVVLGDREKAMNNFNKALMMRPGLGYALVGRGKLHMEAGNYAMARADLEKCHEAGDLTDGWKEIAQKMLRRIQ